MPLYIYKCKECDLVVEKFRHKLDEDEEIVCDGCEGLCEKQFSLSTANSKVWLDAKELYNQKIKPDAERIIKNISSGSDKDFFDIYGDK